MTDKKVIVFVSCIAALTFLLITPVMAQATMQLSNTNLNSLRWQTVGLQTQNDEGSGQPPHPCEETGMSDHHTNVCEPHANMSDHHATMHGVKSE
jgi:hypothetical protein